MLSRTVNVLRQVFWLDLRLPSLTSFAPPDSPMPRALAICSPTDSSAQGPKCLPADADSVKRQQKSMRLSFGCVGAILD